MKKSLIKIVILILTLSLITGAFAGCSGCSTKKANNETTPFVIATEELDGVFNPFFYTSANDQRVMSFLNLSLLAADKIGVILTSAEDLADQPSVAAEVTEKTTGTPVANPTDSSGYHTTYEFLIKPDLKFSDGSPLTIDDVLFNMYVYLDPMYMGSATMYSTKITGLSKYRTQMPDGSGGEEGFDEMMKIRGRGRMDAVIDWARGTTALPADTTQLYKDIVTIENCFKDELTSDWTNAQNSIDNYSDYNLTEGWQVFLLTSGLITIDDDDKIVWNNWDKYTGDKSKDYLIDYAYRYYLNRALLSSFRKNIETVATYWATSVEALNKFIGDEKKKEYDRIKVENGGQLVYETIEGITAKRGETTFNGRTLSKPHDVLSVKINGVDPKAIYNFAGAVTPMKYYSTEAALAAQKLDPDKNFGVEYGNPDFMSGAVRRRVPIGAGPYKVTSKMNKTDETQVEYNEFFEGGVCYLQRNENFMFGSPNIKYLRYQVVNRDNMFDLANSGKIHYAEIDAKPETISKINSSSKLHYKTIKASGYGYVGINAKYVPDINVRKAIMSAMDVSLCLSYYPNDLAQVIKRPMSLSNWAYPQGATDKYPFDNSAQATVIRNYLVAGGYTLKGGVYVDSQNKPLKLTFTIAGKGDHPLLKTFNKAAQILNEKFGCQISVKNDASALSKLAVGGLAVWAAAWTSTPDPDLYQVYHKDSSATALYNWGYSTLLNPDHGGEEDIIINNLSKLIEEGRTMTDRNARKDIYSRALDLIMDLAIELPTYQREEMLMYNKSIIDPSTITQDADLDTYSSLIGEIWKLSYKGN